MAEDASKPTTDAQARSLDVLRVMHDAASTRWVNRREYEWKISYAIWTALAGFIASVILGKDSLFVPFRLHAKEINTWLVIIVLSMPTLIHWYYLNGMVTRTLNDLDLVDEVEKAILQLDTWVCARVTNKHLNSSFLERNGQRRRYGLRAQIGITILLSVAAGWFVFRERSTSDGNAAAASRSTTCQSPFISQGKQFLYK